jgi:hypothetical protein
MVHFKSAPAIASRYSLWLQPPGVATVVATPLADYPYRISVTNEQFAAWVNQQALSIDYKNFKSEVADTRGYGFAKPLNQVWSVMHDVEDEKARVR